MKKIIKRDNGSVRVQEEFDPKKPSKVQQHFRDSTNIQKIMKKYHNDIRMVAPPSRGYYGDFSSAPDFFEARNQMISAQKAFDALPSEIRNRFKNDPFNLLSFLDDPKNKEEAIKLGLVDGVISEPPINDASNATKNNAPVT